MSPDCLFFFFQRVRPLLLLSWLILGLGAPAAIRADSGAACAIATARVAIDDGMTMHYSRAGTGPTILLLHGLFANGDQWRPLLCLLADAGHAVIAPDLPGYGQSRGIPLAEHGLDRQVERLRQFAAALGLDRFDLAGNSLGGTVAALYARAHPEQVRTLAFIGAPFGIADWGPDVREAIHQGINPFIPLDDAQLDLELRLLFVAPPPLPDDARAGLIRDTLGQERHLRQVWDIVNLYDRRLDNDRYMPAGLPTFVLWGRADRIFDHGEGAEALKQHLPGARWLEPAGVGHLPHLEQADATAAAYLEFLASTTMPVTPVTAPPGR